MRSPFFAATTTGILACCIFGVAAPRYAAAAPPINGTTAGAAQATPAGLLRYFDRLQLQLRFGADHPPRHARHQAPASSAAEHLAMGMLGLLHYFSKMHAHTPTHAHGRLHARANMHTHMHQHARARAHLRTHARTRARLRLRTHTRARQHGRGKARLRARVGRLAAAGLQLAASRVELLALINAERVRAGDRPVHLNATLNAIAQGRSEDMTARHYFSHQIPGVGYVFNILDRDHVPYTMAGENIALNNYRTVYSMAETVRQTNADLMNSPDHRANILEPSYTEIGLGLAFTPGTGDLIVTEDFVAP